MPPAWQALGVLLTLSASALAGTFDCEKEVVDKKTFVLKELGGYKDVSLINEEEFATRNTTFGIDICNPIKNVDDLQGHKIPPGSRVVGVERLYTNETMIVERIIPIALQDTINGGTHLDAELELIGHGSSHKDAKREGLRVMLHGGNHPDSGKKQKVIIEFLCDPDLTGNEQFEEKAKQVRRQDDADEDGDGEESSVPEQDQGKSLKLESYDPEGDDYDVLRLTWKTKYACENAQDETPPSKSRGWGWFTWLVIILFLLAAAYIIFGSWLNYNRYGARGWDLIPHGDTIRDLPYIVKDLSSSLVGRLRGEGGSRGGYSAV